ncbi:hypothetical protein GCM10025883_37130 [Mobilicoccus caccae]|uniref:DUF4352 domain-containing protein n=1 Tax=Mobilicoccus caccae TaxID=1859295 RepID=A0ABQ6IWK4_9MICO|nr:hypothetical protein GCM10025883_37130 [Mobilicoccus caccae]
MPLALVALLTLSACAAPAAGVGPAPAAPTSVSSMPPEPASPTPTDAPRAPDRIAQAVPKEIVPVAFGQTVTTPAGVSVRMDPPKGYAPGKLRSLGRDGTPIPPSSEPLTVIRVQVTNGSSAALALNSIRTYLTRDGEPVTKPKYTFKTFKGLEKEHWLRPGGELTVDYALRGPANGVWEAEVAGFDEQVVDLVPWARFASDPALRAATTAMRLQSPKPGPRTEHGRPLDEQ